MGLLAEYEYFTPGDAGMFFALGRMPGKSHE
jgi:hypothetical protein